MSIAMSSEEYASRPCRVTAKQLDILWDFLNNNRDVAHAFNRSMVAKKHSKEKWLQVAKVLNAEESGPSRDWRGWSKYWIDYKAKLKKKQKAETKGPSPFPIGSLTEIDTKFLEILEDNNHEQNQTEEGLEPFSESSRSNSDDDFKPLSASKSKQEKKSKTSQCPNPYGNSNFGTVKNDPEAIASDNYNDRQSLKYARRVSYSQMETLAMILNSNRAMATKYNRSHKDKEVMKKFWKKAASILNSKESGTVKSWREWGKYWIDYKCKLKTKAEGILRELQKTGGDPADVKVLNDIERRLLLVIGFNFYPRPPTEGNTGQYPPTDAKASSSSQQTQAHLIAPTTTFDPLNFNDPNTAKIVTAWTLETPLDEEPPAPTTPDFINDSESSETDSSETTSDSSLSESEPIEDGFEAVEGLREPSQEANANMSDVGAEGKTPYRSPRNQNRRRVSISQLDTLYEILSKNKSMAFGYNRSGEDKYRSQIMWKRAAADLNSCQHGDFKNGQGWCKYWIDYKSVLNKKYKAIERSILKGEETSVSLSDIDKKMLLILGKDISRLTSDSIRSTEDMQQSTADLHSSNDLSISMDQSTPMDNEEYTPPGDHSTSANDNRLSGRRRFKRRIPMPLALRVVSCQQEQMLLTFMEENIEFATASLLKPSKSFSEKWEQLATKLNSCSDSVQKISVKMWRQYWLVLKNRVCRRVVKIGKKIDEVPGWEKMYLTPMDLRIWKILQNSPEAALCRQSVDGKLMNGACKFEPDESSEWAGSRGEPRWMNGTDTDKGDESIKGELAPSSYADIERHSSDTEQNPMIVDNDLLQREVKASEKQAQALQSLTQVVTKMSDTLEQMRKQQESTAELLRVLIADCAQSKYILDERLPRFQN